MESMEDEKLRRGYASAKDFRKHVGEVIRDNRAHKHIKQEDLAKMLGVDRSHLSRYESAETELRTSQMAKASIFCDFPIYEYTEKYRKEAMMKQAPYMFMDVIHESYPHTHKSDSFRYKKEDTKPPKPIVVWDDVKHDWVMAPRIEPIPKREAVSVDIEPEQADSMILEYSYSELKGDKLELLTVIESIIKNSSNYKNRKYSSKIRKLLRAAIDFITFSENEARNDLVSAYIDAYKNR